MGAAPRQAIPPAVGAVLTALLAMLAPAPSSARTPDRIPPTAPAGLRIVAATDSSFRLVWRASTDNRGVTGYDVSLARAQARRVGAPSARFTGLLCGTPYRVRVVARDAAGNRSRPATRRAVTAPCPAPPPPGGAPTPTSPLPPAAPPTAGPGAPEGSGADLPTDPGSTDASAGTAVVPAAPPPPLPPPPPSGGAAPDVFPPTAPLALSISASTTTLAVRWPASTDDVGVVGYDIDVDGTPRGPTNQTSYTAAGLLCGTAHVVAVDAFDAAGNRSPMTSATASTNACPAPATANVFVSTAGSDSGPNCRRFSPAVVLPDATGTSVCRTLAQAYAVAGLGDTVSLAAGSYPPETLPWLAAKDSAPAGCYEDVYHGGSDTASCVTFQPAPGAAVAVGGLTIEGRYIQIRDLSVHDLYVGINSNTTTHQTHDIVLRNLNSYSATNDATGWFITGASRVSVIGGIYGGAIDHSFDVKACVQCTTNPEYVYFDGVTFRDMYRSADGVHTECSHVYGADYYTLRNSRFINCAIYDVFLNNNTDSTPPLHDILIENNFFGRTDEQFCSGCSPTPGSTALDIAPYDTSGKTLNNVVVRFNSSNQPIFLSDASSPTGFVNSAVYGNVIYGSNGVGYCDDKGTVAYNYNVWVGGAPGCGPTDTTAATTGFLAPAYPSVDLHLTAGARGIGFVPASFCGAVSCPVTDIDGQPRPTAGSLDAGADQTG